MDAASPQLEDGHIRIATEIAEALMHTQLSGYQSRILWVIWRKTYGWHKKVDKIPLSQYVQMTGLKQAHVCRTLNDLKNRNIITKNGKKIGFNKNWRAWRELPKMGHPKKGNAITKNGKKSLPKMGHSIDTTKETISKDKYGDFIFLSKDQYKTLLDKYGKEATEWQIENMNTYAHKIGEQKFNNKYKSHYHVAISWFNKNGIPKPNPDDERTIR